MIVVDVGAMAHKGSGRLAGTEESMQKLIKRFDPEILWAFDPHPDFADGWYFDAKYEVLVMQRQAAAWKYGGVVGFTVDGMRSGISNEAMDITVDCINLHAFLHALPKPIILKLDCEGAEFPLLHDIVDHGVDERLKLVLVEWHEGTDPEGSYWGHGWANMGRPELRCPVEEWD